MVDNLTRWEAIAMDELEDGIEILVSCFVFIC